MVVENDNYSTKGFYQFQKFCAKKIRELDIEIMHTHYNHAFIVADKINQTYGVPYFITLHGFEYKWPQVSNSIQVMTRNALNNAHAILSASVEVAKNLTKIVGCNLDERYHYLPNAVNIPKLFKQNTEKNPRKEILFVGRLVPEKGLEYLLTAFAMLATRDDTEELTLTIIGSGELQNFCNGFIQKHHLQSRINMTGELSRSEVDIRLQFAYLVVIPSIYETMPTVLLEAMASGKPVIITDVYGVREVVRDMENGLVIKSKDALQIARKIELLLSSKDLCSSLGKKARETIEQRFTWSHVSNSIVDLYKSALRS